MAASWTMLLLIILALSSTVVQSTKIRLYNACPFDVWPGWIPNAGKPQLDTGGTKLSPWQSFDVYASTNWGGRFWGRTSCLFDGNTPACETGDCAGVLGCRTAGNTPATIAQFALHNNNVDGYSVSVVDGYNLPIKVTTSHPGCGTAGCRNDVNINCPPELAVRNKAGYVVACKSACIAFQKPIFCCTNEYAEDCPSNFYSDKFKESCPTAATYAKDRNNATFACASGTEYTITFCPTSSAASNSLLTLEPVDM